MAFPIIESIRENSMKQPDFYISEFSDLDPDEDSTFHPSSDFTDTFTQEKFATELLVERIIEPKAIVFESKIRQLMLFCPQNVGRQS